MSLTCLPIFSLQRDVRELPHALCISPPHQSKGPLSSFHSVMCVSFHLKQEWGGQPFFPGTGSLEEVGEYQVC